MFQNQKLVNSMTDNFLKSAAETFSKGQTEFFGNRDAQRANIFAYLLSQKHKKQFHLVDHPALAYELSKKNASDLCINLLFPENDQQKRLLEGKSSHHEIMEKKGSYKDPRKIRKDPQRELYQNLKENMKKMLRGMYQCFSSKKLYLSQILEYEQVILGGFLQGFIDEQKKTCKERGEFLEFIWSEMMQLLNTILATYQSKNNLQERYGVGEAVETHQIYQKYLEESEKKRKNMSQQIKKLHQMIDFLVKKMRMRKKQAKKLFKQSQHLMAVVNDLKDKNVDLQIKYIDSTLQADSTGTPDSQIDYIKKSKHEDMLLKKKKELYQIKNQMLLPHTSQRRRKEIVEHELALEGEIDVKKFVEQMKQELQKKQNTDLEIQANMDNLIQEIENDFDDCRYRLRAKPKLTQNQVYYIESKNKAVMTYFEHKSVQTQITYTDKLSNDLINSVGVNASQNQYLKKKKTTNASCQYSTVEAMKIIQSRMEVIRTVLFVYTPSYDRRQSDLSFFDQTLREQFRSSSLLIRYDQNRNKRQKNSELKSIAIQTDYNSPDKDSEASSTSNRYISQNSKQPATSKSKRSRFFSKNQDKIIPQNRKNISRRFSNINENSKLPKKKPNPLKNIAEKDEQNSIKPKQRGVSSTLKKSMEKFSSADLDKQNHRSTSLRNGREDQSAKIFTSLSMKNKADLSPKIHELLSPKSKDFEKKQINLEGIQNFLEKPFDLEDIVEMLNSYLQGSSSQSESQDYTENQNFQHKTFTTQQKLKKNSKNSRKFKASNKKQHKNSTHAELVITKMIKKKSLDFGNIPQVLLSEASSKLQVSLQPIVEDVRRKLRDSTFLTKKLIVPMKQKSLFNIISSIFTKSLEMLRNKDPFKNFIAPLYETMIVIYGSLPKSDIYKKIVNFLAQLHCSRQLPLFKSLLFFISFDDDDSNCQKITTFDIILYLNLIIELSATPSPISEVETAYTTLQKVEEVTPRILQQKNISSSVQKQLVIRMFDKLGLQRQKIGSQAKKQFKLNLFSCARMLISDMITIKQRLRVKCQCLIKVVGQYVSNYEKQQEIETDEKGSQDNRKIQNPKQQESTNQIDERQKQKGISCPQLRILIQAFCLTKLEEVIVLKRVLGYKNPHELINSDQLSTSLLQLRILNFEEFYMKTLIKFKIKSFQALADLESKAILCESKPMMKEVLQAGQSPCQDQELFKQMKALLLMHEIQQKSQLVVEEIMGKQLSLLFSLSLMVLPSLSNKHFQ